MKKEFGKWLMDVAKYLATAVLISSVFNDLGESTAAYWICGGAMLFLLGIGLVLSREKINDKQRNRR
ncbi:DUF6722 family protein [Parabacteroides distasonis]|mgnify:CR=1 FL=1|uniref:DUF6722 family protein n=1 Tax=Parabacteroides distasonis TaxID=823 RepID=UPI00189F0666|nr:DUF6722 family protein [Parabacteroides distasonis]MDB9152448.1 hypothetical protein [Parabacteroides distasonis]MDB9157024.1 hypothetical protein [Parabacteroides distasonis]MDB9166038.1 hypothetical protein [Parabacteroides distasonis]MDB9170458.1 hypothetical protein [Parabacteroides distasonis]MDB9196969.1 hypothetical protein [Parabacteroides distasonis]